MLEGNIFASGGHESSSGKRWGLILLAIAVLGLAAFAGGGIGSVVDGAVSGVTGASGASGGGTAAGGGSGAGASGFSGIAVGFVLLLVGMLVAILRL
jgi:hypothetical protein